MQSRNDRLVGRIFAALNQRAFRVDDLGHLPAAVRAGIATIVSGLDSPQPSAALHAAVDALHADGVFSAPRAHSVHAMIDLHPGRADHAAAGQAIESMQAALAGEADPVERARGVEAAERLWGALRFLGRDYERALEHYIAALELRPSATNMANVLATCIRLGWIGEAEARLADCLRICPPDVGHRLEARIVADPDLAPLMLALPERKAVA